ncbi:MAG: hypothetical protein IT518_04455 [Burkholderiales bacterium]|nr:hypothetical protein [Burkholderiales bacterium]
MATSIPDDAPAPRDAILASVAEQSAAIDEIVGLARLRLMVFDVDLSQCGWHTAQRADALTAFLRRDRQARLDVIVHDTRFLEASCPRLLTLLKVYSHAITIYRTGPQARSAMDPLLIADARHFLHRFHIDQPRAALAIEQPQLARLLLLRFEQIWATGEPGLGATVLGL